MVRYEDAVQVMPPGFPFLLELVHKLQLKFTEVSQHVDTLQTAVNNQTQQKKRLVSKVTELLAREPAAAAAPDPSLLEMMQEVLNRLTPIESAISGLQERRPIVEVGEQADGGEVAPDAPTPQGATHITQ